MGIATSNRYLHLFEFFAWLLHAPNVATIANFVIIHSQHHTNITDAVKNALLSVLMFSTLPLFMIQMAMVYNNYSKIHMNGEKIGKTI